MTDVKVPTMLLTMLSPRRVVSSLVIERQEYITQARGHPCTIRLPAQFRPAASLNRNSLWVISTQWISLWPQVDVYQFIFPSQRDIVHKLSLKFASILRQRVKRRRDCYSKNLYIIKYQIIFFTNVKLVHLFSLYREWAREVQRKCIFLDVRVGSIISSSYPFCDDMKERQLKNCR